MRPAPVAGYRTSRSPFLPEFDPFWQAVVDADLGDGKEERESDRLADHRQLAAAEVRALSADARALVAQWVQSGWLHATAMRS